MNKFKDYKIPFKGLAEGKHDFKFAIGNSFFQDMQSQDLKEGEIQVEVAFNMQQRLFTLDFDLKGYVEIPCDRCLANFHQNVEMTYSLFVKYGEDDGIDDDIIWLDEEAYELPLQDIIHELIALSIPIKRVHPDLKNGEEGCSIYDIEESKEESSDPRWDALKGLKFEN